MKPQNSAINRFSFSEDFLTRHNTIMPMATVRLKQLIKRSVIDLLLCICVIALCFFSNSVLAKETAQEDNKEGQKSFSSLWFSSMESSAPTPAETLSTSISMSISGPILRAKVKQTFRNNTQLWLEGVYSFPLPEQAAVDQLRMRIGERSVEGQIQEKLAAQKRYEQARENGQRASLLSQHRTNIFTTAVANIGPQEDITVEFEYQQLLDFRDHQYTLRFPMVSTPQYTPSSAQLKNDFIAPINLTKALSDKAGNPISISIDLKPGFPIEQPRSISHPISVESLDEEHFTVKLNGSAELSNRDFILSWKLQAAEKPMVSILREDLEGESYGFMMIMPPQTRADQLQISPRELIWVLDVSGSMQGESIEQARSAMLKALSRLRPEDYFNIICFNNRAWKLFPDSRSGTRDNLNLARKKILALEADGGTEMQAALNMALEKQSNSERLRQIIFVTDGAVSNEAELFSTISQHLGDSRLFTIGIGSAPNSYFMRKAALAGRGSFTYISQAQEVNSKIDRLLRKLEAPALTDLGFDLNDPTVNIIPQRLPDLYLGEPVYISFKADHFPNYAQLSGNINGLPSNLRLPLHSTQRHKGIAVEWARRKITELVEGYQQADLETKTLLRDEALELAIAHHQVSQFTSLVAVDDIAERAGAQLDKRLIPANAPKGWVSKSPALNQGIRLAKTATNTPFNLLLGVLCLGLAFALWPARTCMFEAKVCVRK